MSSLLRAVWIVLLLPAAAARAQQPPTNCAAPEHRQFDFWEGDWVVTDSAGTVTYGTSTISREESGCLLRERWTAAAGGTGQSINFYDRVAGGWAQVWVASNGSVLRLAGGLEGTAMRLEGQTRPAGAVVRNRITWTPQLDGRVRQTWTISRDGGSTWQVSFDGWYRRRS
jgi:hypothetical protein